jgi:hypothetical protein
VSVRDVWGDTSVRSTTTQKSGIRYTSDGVVRQTDPSDVVRAFKRADGSDDRTATPLPELPLPGFGEAYEDCGEDFPRFCADCGATHTVGRTCYRSTCPRCAPSWARDRAATAAGKLEATRRYKESKRDGWSGYKFHHLTLSPPDEFATFSPESLDRTFEILKEVLDELGASTGYLFFHPFRGEAEDEDDRGEWKERLFDEEREWEGDVREELEFSPHFHAVVIAKYVDGSHVTRAIEEQTGWLVHRITKSDDSDVSIYGKYDLARVVSYCLSHTGLEEKESGRTRAAYRAFGRTANLTATDEIAAEMDAAVRSVAPRTLGLSWSSVACQEDRGDREPQSALVAGTEAAYDAGGGPVGEDGEGLHTPDDEADKPDGVCAGRLMRLSTAPRFLEDEEWCERAPRVDELREACREWPEELPEDYVVPPPD